MELSDAGRKVWEMPYHPLYANNLGDGTTFVGAPGVPFGWVVAKDCMAADGRVGRIEDGAELAMRKAMALCNTLAEDGL